MFAKSAVCYFKSCDDLKEASTLLLEHFFFHLVTKTVLKLGYLRGVMRLFHTKFTRSTSINFCSTIICSNLIIWISTNLPCWGISFYFHTPLGQSRSWGWGDLVFSHTAHFNLPHLYLWCFPDSVGAPGCETTCKISTQLGFILLLNEPACS